MDSKIIYIDNIDQNSLRIFYKKDLKCFELRSSDNIDSYNKIESHFFSGKIFIEETEEEFEDSEGSLDELSANILYLKSDSYELFLNKIRTILQRKISLIGQTKKLNFAKDRNDLLELEEILGLYNFLSKYFDLKNDDEYSQCAYYSISSPE